MDVVTEMKQDEEWEKVAFGVRASGTLWDTIRLPIPDVRQLGSPTPDDQRCLCFQQACHVALAWPFNSTGVPVEGRRR